MKVISAILIILLSIFIFNCGQSRIIDGVTYETYGLLNKEDFKDPKIQYRIIYGNVIWSAILCESIVAPIYFFGFSLYEPVYKKKD